MENNYARNFRVNKCRFGTRYFFKYINEPAQDVVNSAEQKQPMQKYTKNTKEREKNKNKKYLANVKWDILDTKNRTMDEANHPKHLAEALKKAL